jgi:hypothetical protein
MKYSVPHANAPRFGLLALSIPLLFAFSTASPLGLRVQPAPSPSNLESTLLGEGQVAEDLDGCDDASSLEPMGPPSLIQGTVIRSTGAIEADLTAFRALLGNPINGAVPGQQLTGHREINWDAVPAAVTNVTDFPAAFFNTTSTRGLVYDLRSRGLEVSDQRFTDINPTYASEFNPFSGLKVFSPVGNNISDVEFLVSGSDTEAAVRGFGAVFMDVDVEGSTGLILIAEDGRPLGSILAPARSDARGASFVGVVLDEPVIGRVRIVSGNGHLAPNQDDISQGGHRDLVVVDDILYGEPTATGN